jgi:SAM-dependent MidA family methyltransferase
MRQALYGPSGFYRHNSPDQHFRTSVTASPLLAEALSTLVVAVDEALGRPEVLDVVDVGAGDGSLLGALLDALPVHTASRVRAIAVDLRERPAGLPSAVTWTDTAPRNVVGLIFAHEYLDNVPVDVVEVAADGRRRTVLVAPHTGEEGPGAGPTPADEAWLDHWWPITEPGVRAEVGSPRDAAWGELVGRIRQGLALAVDYGHLRSQRTSSDFPLGTLTGYRGGHQVAPVPDGSCDITAHVAMDACLRAGEQAGAEASALIRQRDALRALGLHAQRPPRELAHTDPLAYVEGLSRASHAAELLEPASLGSFWWLLQAKDCRPAITDVTWA